MGMIYNKSKLVKYFEDLGYTVSWDFNGISGEHWFEIYKDNELIVQIDSGVPIEAIRNDLIRLYEGLEMNSNYNYKITGPDSEEFFELQKKVKENDIL